MKIGTIGHWSEVKLEIIEKYASAYARILAAQSRFTFYYIDAFAGAGVHISRATNKLIAGSPLIALRVRPQFAECHFIDLADTKVKQLGRLARISPRVHVYHEDCNDVLLRTIFPKVRFDRFRRALCLLDPYGLHLDWSVVADAGRRKTIELFINFPLHDMHRNVLWKNPEASSPEHQARMTRFWGDETWRKIAYQTTEQTGLWGNQIERAHMDDLGEGYRRRLKEIAGFKYVPRPVLMRNSINAPLYFLFFASHKESAYRIANDIFRPYR